MNKYIGIITDEHNNDSIGYYTMIFNELRNMKEQRFKVGDKVTSELFTIY